MKNVFIALLVLCITVGAVFGRGQTERDGAEATGGESASGEVNTVINGYDYGDTGGINLPISAKPITVRYLIPEHPSHAVNEDRLIYDLLEEVSNIELELMPIGEAAIAEKVKLLHATGDLPDMVVIRGLDVANQIAPLGGLVNISEYLDQLPNYSRYLEDFPIEKDALTASDGNIYVMPLVNEPKYKRIWLYRKDIFEKHDLEPPRNAEELYDTLTELKELYPGTYPLSGRWGIGMLEWIAYQWKTGKDMYFNFDNDKWQFGPVEDNYREMLEFLNRLYEDGLLDEEWLTLTTTQWEDKIINDQSFVSVDWIYRIDTMRPKARPVNPDWNLAALDPIIKEGLGERKVETQLDFNVNIVHAVSLNNDHPLESLKLYDFMLSPGGTVLTNFGKIGETAKVLSDGTITYVDEIKTPANLDGQYAWNTYYGFMAYGTKLKYHNDYYQIEWPSEEFNEAFDRYEANDYAQPFVPKPKFSREELQEITQLESALVDFTESECAKFIINGNFKDWDAYVSEAKSMNSARLESMYNEVHKR